MPAPQPPPPPKPESKDKALQDIIDGIMNAKENTPKEKTTTPATPQGVKENNEKKEKWRSYSEEKQKKIYENTVSKLLIGAANILRLIVNAAVPTCQICCGQVQA